MEKDNPADVREAKANKKAAHKPAAERPKNLGALVIESGPGVELDRANRRRGTEADQLHGLQPPPEHIGQMLLEAEAKPGDKSRPAETIDSGTANKRTETLSRAELLALSDKIMVDGSNLHQIYETHLVGERGLRRLVAEYLQGGDIKAALHHEIIEHEMDFERDPVLRDMAVHQAPGSADNGKSSLDELLERAELNSSDDHNEQTDLFRAQARQEVRQLYQHKKRQQAVNLAFSIVIAALVASIIILYLASH